MLGQLYATAALSLHKPSLLPFEYDPAWVPEPVWMFLVRDISLTSAQDRSTIPRTSKPRTIHYTEYAVPAPAEDIFAIFDARPLQTNAHRFYLFIFFFDWWVYILQPSSGAIASSLTRFLDHAQRRATVGRTLLDEWSARRTNLYLTTHNTHDRQTSMPPVGFEPTISAGERPQTHALDRAATGTGNAHRYRVVIRKQLTSFI